MFVNFGDNCSTINSSYAIDDRQKNLASEHSILTKCLPVFQSEPNSLQSILVNKISPYVIIVITCTNTLVCIVLSRPSMITPTNIILLAMAIADMLTGLFPFPIYIMQNNLHQSSFMLKNTYLAYLNFYLTSVFPTTFHTASVWLTITLAFQRVIYVKLPTFVSKLCTNRISIITSTLIFFFAFFMHSINLMYSFEIYYQICQNNVTIYIKETKIPVTWNLKNYSHVGKMMKCSSSANSSLFLYNSSRIVLLHIIPCVLLTILTALLLIVLKQKSNLSKKLLLRKKNRAMSTQDESLELSIHRKSQNPTDHASARVKCNKDSSSSTSKMLVVVLLIFLSVEIPMGAVITLYVILKTLNVIGTKEHIWFDTTNICNFLLLISYPLNFVIYCIMSKKFRDTFKETLCPNRIFNIITNSYVV